jgi:hypothetical protein
MCILRVSFSMCNTITWHTPASAPNCHAVYCPSVCSSDWISNTSWFDMSVNLCTASPLPCPSYCEIPIPTMHSSDMVKLLGHVLPTDLTNSPLQYVPMRHQFSFRSVTRLHIHNFRALCYDNLTSLAWTHMSHWCTEMLIGWYTYHLYHCQQTAYLTNLIQLYNSMVLFPLPFTAPICINFIHTGIAQLVQWLTTGWMIEW